MKHPYRSNDSENKFYRDKEHCMIAGVCAGIADYFGLDRWLVRIITITLLVFTNSLVIFIYILAWIVFDKKPDDYMIDELEKEFAFERIKRKVTSGNGISDTFNRFSQLELRMRRLEAFITSKRYNLSKEINDL